MIYLILTYITLCNSALRAGASMELERENQLDAAIISHLSQTEAGQNIAQIAREIRQPYTTVLVHILSLAAAGTLRLTWHGRDRYVSLAKTREHVTCINTRAESP